MRIVLFVFLLAGILNLSFKPPVTKELGIDTVKNNGTFKKGEFLKYRVHYGFIDAGDASVEIKNENQNVGGTSILHVLGLGYSNSFFDWIFKVRDRYETYIDEEAMVPLVFVRRVDEGGYIIKQDLVFNHGKKKVDSNGQLFDVPENVQDMLSAFYYARCIDYSTAEIGEIFTIPGFVDNEYFPIKIRYVGRETIDSDVGRVRCIKFRPVLQKGRIFKKEEDLKVWISDDKNHVPIRAQADILIGSLKMDLTEYTGLANEISKE